MAHFSLALIHKSKAKDYKELENEVFDILGPYGDFVPSDAMSLKMERDEVYNLYNTVRDGIKESGNDLSYKDFIEMFYPDAVFDYHGNLMMPNEDYNNCIFCFEIGKESRDIINDYENTVSLRDENLVDDFITAVSRKREMNKDILKKMSYEEYIKILYEHDFFDVDGNFLYISNGRTFYDWFQIGGRWKNMLTEKETGEKGDSFKLKDIDFEAMEIESGKFHTYGIMTPDGKVYDAYSFEDEYEDLSYEDHKLMWIDRYDSIFFNPEYEDMTITIVDYHS